jgi:energy-converting hydrogenase Eha subunit G
MRVLDAASPFWLLKALVRAVIMFAGFGGAAVAASFVAIYDFSLLSNS